jgi:hypothetical protein
MSSPRSDPLAGILRLEAYVAGGGAAPPGLVGTQYDAGVDADGVKS